MAWFYLGIAGLLEVAWAVGLKLSDGFRKPLIAAPTVVGMVLSFYFLALALRTLPLGTAYATWTGIGALGTLVVGMLCFDEPFGWLRVLFAALAIGGLAGGAGNFVCVRVPEGRTAELCKRLEDDHIYVRDISARFHGYVRITIGLEMDRVAEALHRASRQSWSTAVSAWATAGKSGHGRVAR